MYTTVLSTIQLGVIMTYILILFMICIAYTFSQFVTCLLTFLIEVFTYIFKLHRLLHLYFES